METKDSYAAQVDTEAEGSGGELKLGPSDPNSFMAEDHFISVGDSRDITVAIASFLQEEDFIVETESELTQQAQEEYENELPENSAEVVVEPAPIEEPPPPPTAVDETIERVIRWEDCTDISTIVRPPKIKTELEVTPTTAPVSEAVEAEAGQGNLGKSFEVGMDTLDHPEQKQQDLEGNISVLKPSVGNIREDYIILVRFFIFA